MSSNSPYLRYQNLHTARYAFRYLLGNGLFILSLFACQPNPTAEAPDAHRTWSSYLGDPGRTHYSSLNEINLSNIDQLEVAWEYHAGKQGSGGTDYIQCNPLVIDRTLFAVSPGLKVFAVDAATGEEQWVFNPFEGTNESSFTRGLAYWSDGTDTRILFTADRYLYALDAQTGQLMPSFGEEGKVNLGHGLGRDIEELVYKYHAPGTVYEDLIIMGALNSESSPAAPGHIRAFDVRTGEQKWIFHTIPQPGELGYDTWEDSTAYRTIGGVNNWSGMTLDEDRGIVFVPLGSAASDFYGGNRKGANLFANCLLALDATTGKHLWHFQTVHHDVWDRDLPSPPTLITTQYEGKAVDAVAQITKSGHVYVFDRETGESLFPIEERAYPASDLIGEETWPTQPLPTRPPAFARQQMTEADINPYSEDKDSLLAVFHDYRSAGQFVPPSTEGTVIFPGLDGGGEWGGAGYDPNENVLYVNANEMPWILKMVEVEENQSNDLIALGEQVYQSTCMGCHGAERQGSNFHGNAPALIGLDERMDAPEVSTTIRQGRGDMPSFAFLSDQQIEAVTAFLLGTADPTMKVVQTSHKATIEADPSTLRYNFAGYNRFVDSDGYPAVKPPWGTLNAIDLTQGKILWQVPLGEFPELTERGIPKTGTENYGGPVVTAGGLIFIGATKDPYLRAFDKKTGEEVWKYLLPAPGMATPCTYEVDGRQYVVIAAGGGKNTEQRDDRYVAFALPE
ncbi:MAG: PQQ-binding-like beta-propeller repeat protein [Bacteroidota bacterium]